MWGVGRINYLRVGWELLCPGGDEEAGVGGFRWNGKGGSGITKPVVYNTLEEIKKFEEVLQKIAGVMN